MKKLRYTILSMLLTVSCSLFAASQQTAYMRIPEMTIEGDKEFELPIELVNSVPVVGVQFELFFPDNASVYYTGWPGMAQERRVDHEMTQPYLWEGRSTVDGIRQRGFMIYSPTNTPFIGNSGAVAKIALAFPSALYPDGSEVHLRITDVIITTAYGENIAVESEIGTITIAKGPDLEVKRVTSTGLVPGEQATVQWEVNNIGTLATGGGWRENIAIVSIDGSYTRGLATVHYDEILAAEGSLQRSATFEVPKVPGIDGSCNVQVTLSPNSDTFESPVNRGNNTATCGVTVARRLYLDTPRELGEGHSYPVRACIERSGSVADAMTYTLTKKGDDRMTLPAEVTVPAGSSYEYFYFNIVNDDTLNDTDHFAIAASGSGYGEVSADVTITDDEIPTLTLSVSKEEVTEGESFVLTITPQRPAKEDVSVALYCDNPRRFSHPSAVVLPAGAASVDVEIAVVDNEDVDDEVWPVFRASAYGYQPAETDIVLTDNDMPTIELEIGPTTVKESAGPYAISAKIRRLTQTDKRVTIKLSDTSKGRLIYRNSIVLDKGIEEAEFTVGVADNILVDGDEDITFTAAVYMSSCSCTAATNTGGAVEAVIKVIDNDGPSLTVATDNATWLEGTTHTITVTRNTVPTDALVVELSSDKDAMLQYDHTVTIPAGQAAVTVPVKVLSNDVSGDGGTVTFMAQSADHSMGACFVLISDQTLPDATIASISVSPTEVEVGNTATVTIGLKNEGASDIPAHGKVNVYANGKLWFTVWNDEAVAPGATFDIVKSAVVPETPIAYSLTAAVNEDKAFEELSYSNNRRDEGVLTVTPGFHASVNVDRTVCRPGETVTISGHATGSKAKDADVEVYLIGQTRIVLTAKANANGDFSAEWTSYEFQNGRYAIGACYPGENLSTEMAAVDVYGIAVSTDKTGLEPSETDEVKGVFTVTNTGSLPLSNIAVAVASKPDNCIVTLDRTSITALAAGEQVSVGYTLVGYERTEGKDWAKINFSATAAEKVSSTDYLNYYCHPLYAVLETDTDVIEATATRGQARDYTVHLTNAGRGETGPITLAISTPWIKAVTPTTMPSLASGQSADIVLSFRTENLQLNVEQTATIGINCEKGDGIPLRIKLTPVSESVGTLTIDACDQYTYRTEEAPHVKGATVTIKSPNTYKLVAEGVTGEDGHYSIELPEGYYDVTVSAPDHATYNNIIMVNPGRDSFRTVNLSFTGGVTVTYNVEPVEGGIEDEYEIVTTVVYETHVPAPVVVLTGPEKVDIDAMAIGESQLLYFYATNKGLITALDYEFFIPEDTREYTFKCLSGTGPFDLAANQMVAFPVMLTKIADIDQIIAEEEAQNAAAGMPRRANAGTAIKSCVEGFSHRYYDLCGESLTENKGALKMMMRACAITGMFAGLGGSGGSGGPSSGNGGYGTAGSGGGEVMVGGSRNICDHDTAEAADKMTSMLAGIAAGQYGFICAAVAKGIDWGLTGTLEGWGAFCKAAGTDFLNSLISLAVAKEFGALQQIVFDNYNNYLTAAGFDGPDATELLSQLSKLNSMPYSFAISYRPRRMPAADMPAQRDHASVKIVLPEWMKEYMYYTFPFAQQLEIMYYHQLEMFGDECWLQGDPDVAPFLQAIEALPEGGTYNDVRQYKPTSVSHEQAERLFERIRNAALCVNGQPEGVENCPDMERLLIITNELRRRDDWAKEEGFESCADAYDKYQPFLAENIEMAEASICAHITLQFTQKMVMTREAFRGTLTVYNGHDDKPMENAVLNLTVLGPDGYPVTKQKMDVSLESVDKFSASSTIADGVEWSLGNVAAKETAKATVLYIPTKFAAPDQPLDYTFQGSLTYTDPFTGMTVTEEFMPTTLTVNPSPVLDMTYFMQRDIFGDDPLTPEVEAIEPAEFSILINNVGNGDAMNVKMMTKGPEIVDNEKGLLVDFDLYGSALNGNEVTMAIGGQTVTDFGAVPAGKTVFAQWWFTSTLLGHFIDYDVKATHVTSHDNHDLSLLGDVTIHEMIRSVKYGPEASDVAFLCDDIFDRNDTPDHLYLSNGVVEEVSAALGYMQRANDAKYWLKLQSCGNGWNYLNTVNYNSGRELVKVTRSDGKVIDLRNVWMTDRTLRDGHDPLYENKIHIVDLIEDNTKEVFYTLEYADLPSNVLEVTAFTGIPNDDTVYEGSITEVDVVFNAAVDASTFTTDDITLYFQGKRLDESEIVIKQKFDNVFTLDLSALTGATGYYVLTVNTTEILDTEGNRGKVGRQATWSQSVGDQTYIKIVVVPEGYGTVDVASGYYQRGSVLTLTATPAENCRFVEWVDLSTDNPFTLTVDGNCTITALFASADSVIDTIDDSNGRSDVYNLQGICVMRDATIDEMKSRLPSGIYIIGGRKVLITNPMR